MRIIITAPSLNNNVNVGGISTVVKTIIEHNKQHSYYHYLLGKPDRPMNKMIGIMKLLLQLLKFPFYLMRNKIAIVHQNFPFDPKGLIREFTINLWCRLLNTPVVLHVHGGVMLMNGTRNLVFKMLAKSLFDNSKVVVVLSVLEKDALKKLYHYNSSTVLNNSIDTIPYSNSIKRLSVGKPSILFLGRIHESKGVDDIIVALEKLKKEIDFRFILCGTGPLENYFVNSCKRILDNDFEFKGIVSGANKIEIIKQSDVFLLPSRYGEGLPIALLETMAAGVVPVVTDDASMKFVVQHEVNGIRVNKKDPTDLYEKLKSLLTNHLLFEQLSKNAAKTVAEKYNISNYIIQLNKIYDDAIK
jgi:glycosyltransferase involved in cell wall biosynthesis